MFKTLIDRILRDRLLLVTCVVGAIVATLITGAVLAVAFVDPSVSEKVQSRLAPAPPAPAATTGDDRRFEWETFETALMTLERAEIHLGQVDISGTAGAIDMIGDTFIYVSGSGQFAVVDLDAGEIAYQDIRAPLRYEEFSNEVFVDKLRFRHPQYRVNDLLVVENGASGEADVYVSHVLFVPESESICAVINTTRVALNGAALEQKSDWREFYRAEPCLHLPKYGDWSIELHQSGGGLEHDGDHVLFTVGDFGLADHQGHPSAVQPDAPGDLSKLLRINLETGEKTHYAVGLRNTQGLAFGSDGRLWATDHGPQGGDEVNLVRAGGDYGWPNVSYGTAYGAPRAPLPLNPVQGRHAGYVKPAFALLPSTGLTDLTVVPDDGAFELWRGDLLVLALSGQILYRMRLDGDTVVYAEPMPIRARLRDVVMTDSGTLALLTGRRSIILLRDPDAVGDDAQGAIEISGYDAVEEHAEERISAISGFDWRRSQYRRRCASCHRLDGEVEVAPPLNDLIGRTVGSFEGYAYSDALAGSNDRWTAEKVMAYVRDPENTYPGSYMAPLADISDGDLRGIVEYLEETEFDPE